jgi:hypothetical protein
MLLKKLKMILGVREKDKWVVDQIKGVAKLGGRLVL